MKKVIVLILLAAGSLAVSAVLLIMNLVTMLGITFTTVVLAVFISMAVAFGTAGFYKKLHLKFGINAPLYWIFAYAPELAIGAGVLLWGYYQSFRYLFVGASTLLIFYVIPITGIAYGLWGAVFTYVSARKIKGAQ